MEQTKSRIKLVKLCRWLVVVFFTLVVCVGGFFFIIYLLGPPPLDTTQNTIYYSSNGEKIGEERGVENRYWVTLEEINDDVIEATIQLEDQHFYNHNGFDFKRMSAALINNIRSGSLQEGASTITQQYARNLYLSHEKNWTRKIKEAFYAIRLEAFYDKDTILEGYLNTIYYGHGVYGIEAASQLYFDKTNTDLTLAESALLAGVPNRPNFYSPINHFENAKQRQEQLIRILVNREVITDKEADLARNEDILIASIDPMYDKTNQIGYFRDVVLREMADILDLEQQEIRSSGYEVYTTLNIDDQTELQKAVVEHTAFDEDFQAGAVALDPNTGAITALTGGVDYDQSPFNRAVQAQRMVGSTFKPFLYYTALANGYTAATTLVSQPTTFLFDDGSIYRPRNFNSYYADDSITLAQALAVSDNIYAVKTNLFVTPELLVSTAKDFGITSDMEPVPALALGTASVSVKEMVTAYGMFANGGKEVDPYTIEKIIDADGETVYEREPIEPAQVLDPQQTFILNQLMTGMFDVNLNSYMAVTGAPIADELSGYYAGKSGSTSSDSWMIGYSPELVMGVWTGYDDNRELTNTQAKQAARGIWANFIDPAHSERDPDPFDVPEGIVAAYVDPHSGLLSTPNCPTSRLMYFVEGTEPRQYCKEHTGSLAIN